MLELGSMLIIVLIFIITAIAILSSRISIMGLATFVIMSIVAMEPSAWVILNAIVAVFLMSLVLFYRTRV